MNNAVLSELVERIKYLEKNSNTNNQSEINKKNINALNEALKTEKLKNLELEERIKRLENTSVMLNSEIANFRTQLATMLNMR